MYKKQKTKKGKQSTALWQQHQEQSSSTTQIETCSTAKLTDLLPRKRMGQNHNIPFCFLRCKQSHRELIRDETGGPGVRVPFGFFLIDSRKHFDR